MTRLLIDWIVKGVVLTILAVFAFSYWQRRDNGRYEYHLQPATSEDGGSLAIVDTRTGTAYLFLKGQWVEVHPQTGVSIPRKVTRP